MRQTLLVWKMVEAGEYGCDEFLHVHVIPKGNKELLDVNTSPLLEGDGLEETWKGVLKKPELYMAVDSEDLLAPVLDLGGTKPIIAYLKNRYWS